MCNLLNPVRIVSEHLESLGQRLWRHGWEQRVPIARSVSSDVELEFLANILSRKIRNVESHFDHFGERPTLSAALENIIQRIRNNAQSQ
jgi:hypothetical protein